MNPAVKQFLWTLFAKGIDLLTLLLSMKAAKTVTKLDDAILKMVQGIGDKFIPGEVSSDGLSWAEKPAMTKEEKGSVVKTVSSITVKELLLLPEFRTAARLSDAEADRLLIVTLTFLKPDAVDTPEEIQAILDKIKPEVLL